jgi:hypothetical protein
MKRFWPQTMDDRRVGVCQFINPRESQEFVSASFLCMGVSFFISFFLSLSFFWDLSSFPSSSSLVFLSRYFTQPDAACSLCDVWRGSASWNT